MCCTSAAFKPFFGAHVQTIVSLVPTALGSERQILHVSEKKEPSTCVFRPQTCAPLSSTQVFHHILVECVAALNEGDNFLAAYGACSGGTDFGDALRMVLAHWPNAFHDLNSALPPPPSGMKVSPDTGLIRKVANLLCRPKPILNYFSRPEKSKSNHINN